MRLRILKIGRCGRMTIAQIYESAKRRLDKNEITIGEFCNVVDITVDAYKPPIGHNCNEDYADCDQFVCSECGIELQDWHRVERDLDDGDISYHEYTFRFCPNCGAKIEEVRE